MLNLSIRSKITLVLVINILIASFVVGIASDWSSRNIIEKRLLNSELPNIVQNITANIDSEIDIMMTVAKTLANDTYINAWLTSKNSKADEHKLIDKLNLVKRDFELSSASFANRSTAEYWNHDGFLRVLKNNAEDGWFYAYKNSNKASAVSLYIYPDGKRVELFVNYQQLNGNGLAGVAKSFDDMANMLNTFKIEQTGFVFLVDATGQVKLHNDKSLVNSQSLASLYQQSAATQLLQQQSFALQEVMYQGKSHIISTSYIPSMDWYVVASVPKAEVFAEINQSRTQIFLLVFVIAIIGVIIASFFVLPITRPIENLVETFNQLGKGDANLNVRLDENGQKELASVAQGFNAFLANLATTMAQVNRLSDELKQVAAIVSKKSNESLEISTEHNEETATVVESVTQMDSAVTEVAENAANAAQTANIVLDNTKHVQTTMTNTRASINELVNQVSDVEQVLTSLDKSAEDITAVLDVINSISEQTNLLALNAAIEAARAGEHGRGFSVVADEVRQLSKRTSESIGDIQQIISSLTENTQAAVSQISTMVEKSTQSTQTIASADAFLIENSKEITHINDINHTVASATEQQASVITDVNQHLKHLNEKAQYNAEIANQLAYSSTDLARLAESLDELVAKFTA